MDMDSVTHQQIYDRLVAVELKVDSIHDETRTMISAFQAAHGAFTVLEWIAKVAKPILLMGALFTAIAVWWQALPKVK